MTVLHPRSGSRYETGGLLQNITPSLPPGVAQSMVNSVQLRPQNTRWGGDIGASGTE
jgi:hypothetical protein